MGGNGVTPFSNLGTKETTKIQFLRYNFPSGKYVSNWLRHRKSRDLLINFGIHPRKPKKVSKGLLPLHQRIYMPAGIVYIVTFTHQFILNWCSYKDSSMISVENSYDTSFSKPTCSLVTKCCFQATFYNKKSLWTATLPLRALCEQGMPPRSENLSAMPSDFLDLAT